MGIVNLKHEKGGIATRPVQEDYKFHIIASNMIGNTISRNITKQLMKNVCRFSIICSTSAKGILEYFLPNNIDETPSFHIF